MPLRPLLCYITDRTQFPGDESARRRQLLDKIAEAARAGVDYIQLREKELATCDLESLANHAVRILRDPQLRTEDREPGTVLLINSRTDVAIAVGARGVHLPANDISPAEAHGICERSRGAGGPGRLTISVACHTPSEVGRAGSSGADFALFAPVFEKRDAKDPRPAGLDVLRRACLFTIPVLALGGINLDNAASCLAAGAAGIAAIRLFQENDIAEVVRRLHGLSRLAKN